MGCLKLQTDVREKPVYWKVSAGQTDFFWESTQMWLSVDPMADKYPSWSPFTYCMNNPIKLMDPNGMEVINEYAAAYKAASTRLDNAKSALDAFGGNKKADGYKAAKQELRQAKSDFAGVASNYQQVESAIGDLKKYNPDLFAELDALDDENGNRVDIYVGINSSMSDRGVLYDNFDGENFYSKHGKNSLQIELNPGSFENPNDLGEMLSHEGGHGAYSVKNNRSYSNWLQNEIKNPSKHNGHDNEDPSGEAAYDQQRKYCRNKGIQISY